MGNMIFIGGIHGVGKTYFSNKISQEYNIEHYSASELIANRKKEIFSRDKKVDNIGGNQDFLKEALRQIILGDKCFLLDGHFCLLTKDNTIIRIPEETFYSLSPKAIVVLTDSVGSILNRLSERDGIIYDEKFIQEFLDEELEYSREISVKLNIPYFIHDNSGNSAKVYDFISDILNC